MENKDITKEGPLTHKDLQKDNSLNNFEDLDFETLDQMVQMRRQARQQPQPSLLDYQRMYTPERETPVGNLAAEAGFGKSKFDKGLTDINQLYDLDDIRGSNQRWYDQLGNASVKMVSLAGTTFLQGTLGFAWGAGTAIKDWRVSGLWDNAVSQGIAEFTEWTEEVLPNYYSDYEKEGLWYKHFWTSNFWGDKFLKNLGFTIGAYYSGQVFANMMSNMKFRGLANVFGKSLAGAENAARAPEQLAFTNNILGKIGKKGILESSKRAAKTANIPQQITAAIGATTSRLPHCAGSGKGMSKTAFHRQRHRILQLA